MYGSVATIFRSKARWESVTLLVLLFSVLFSWGAELYKFHSCLSSSAASTVPPSIPVFPTHDRSILSSWPSNLHLRWRQHRKYIFSPHFNQCLRTKKNCSNSNQLWAVLSAVGAGLCFLVLSTAGMVSLHPQSRKYLDRVSFRMAMYALAAKYVMSFPYGFKFSFADAQLPSMQHIVWDCKRHWRGVNRSKLGLRTVDIRPRGM